MSRKMESNAGSSGENSSPTPLRNPFQKSGSQPGYEVTETKKAMVMRADLPGCPESDLTYWVDTVGNNVHFFADEPAMPEYENAGRKYGGSMVVNPKAFDLKKAQVKLINGVLWITVPKFPGKKASLGVVQKLIHLPEVPNKPHHRT
ncbi:PREDICTED: 14.7 kDa heat shock protein-like [Camelina sativa]|uniref:14.7 kDa heat shock protein-like n=1 Tax=Camelina sativa TaxID=90675 RepID=A0ABM0Y3T8_CAMSA|nr:PREDICTED: 14.7 kDa heat shock protein-like [Camelina sativa]